MEWPTHIVVAGGYVIDKYGNILLVKTHDRGWGATGGKIENGENIEDGVLREILEESGINASVKCLVGIYSNVAPQLHCDGISNIPTKIMLDFICDYIDGQPTASNETNAAIWVPQNNVMDYITTPAVRFRFQKILEFSGKVCYCSFITKPEFKVLTERYI